MGGACQALVFGFGGMRTNKDGLSFAPKLPERLEYLSFKVRYKGKVLKVEITKDKASYTLLEGESICLSHYGSSFELKRGQTKEFILAN